jgi:hypothetical protein
MSDLYWLICGRFSYICACVKAQSVFQHETVDFLDELKLIWIPKFG